MAYDDTIVLAQPIVSKQADIKKLTRDVELRAQAAVYQLGQETRDMARVMAPMDTGALKASIYVTKPGTSADQAAGKMSASQSTGYRRAAMAAIRRNPNRLEWQGDKQFSQKTQRDLSHEDHTFHIKNNKVELEHTGKNKRLGKQTYTAGEDDWRTITPMAAQSRSRFFVVVGASAYYAAFVEYGTSRSKAQPFLTPAVNWARKQLPKRLKAAIGKEAAAHVV